MVPKIYGLVWLLAFAFAAFLFATGAVGELTTALLGFTFSTLLAMGLFAVLPWWVDKNYAPGY
jgi:hypothetical protein